MQIKTNEVLTTEMQQIKSMIIDTVTQRNAFKTEMELWYQNNPKLSYPNMKNLILIDATLSKLDSFYKQLWDYHNKNNI